MEKSEGPAAGPEFRGIERVSKGLSFLHPRDRKIRANAHYSARWLLPPGASAEKPAERAVFLLHGLNEKNWDKYSSWAEALARKAEAAVLMLPIAFHMERAPAFWSEPAAMRALSAARTKFFPGLRGSSLANAAMSRRLEEAPSRMMRAGLQSATDLDDLLGLLRSGGVAGVSPGAAVGFFGYSIGAFLLQALAIRDPSFLESSRAFLFSGGPFLSGMDPVSRYIMDSRAHERLVGYWVRDLRDELRGDPETRDFAEGTEEGRAFVAMCDAKYHPERRREGFRAAARRMFLLNLASDRVMPPAAARECLGDSGIGFELLDAPAQCGHENPFPPLKEIAGKVGSLFDSVFDRAALFLFA